MVSCVALLACHAAVSACRVGACACPSLPTSSAPRNAAASLVPYTGPELLTAAQCWRALSTASLPDRRPKAVPMRPRSSARRSSSASALWMIAWNSFRSGASRCRPCGQGTADQGLAHADDGMMLLGRIPMLTPCQRASPALLPAWHPVCWALHTTSGSTFSIS